MTRYPAELPVFAVISQEASGSEIPIGTHVEGGGPCCLNSDRPHNVMLLNGYSEDDSWQWTHNLRPLTRAARQMLAIAQARR